MEWTAPAIVLDARPFGDADAIVTVMAEAQGNYRGLAKGGASRGKAALWQAGNLVQAHWAGRLENQLGGIVAEMVHPTAALAMDDSLVNQALAALCAVAEQALPEREPHPAVFSDMVRVLAHLGRDSLPDVIRWELALLAELGYGLDLSRCALTGAESGLAFVSPRSGRAVTWEAAGEYREKLLPLPSFLVGGNSSDPADWRNGLALTGHFLARHAFGQQHRPIPAARQLLFDKVEKLAQSGAG